MRELFWGSPPHYSKDRVGQGESKVKYYLEEVQGINNRGRVR
jgi:hypothetical protein